MTRVEAIEFAERYKTALGGFTIDCRDIPELQLIGNVSLGEATIHRLVSVALTVLVVEEDPDRGN